MGFLAAGILAAALLLSFGFSLTVSRVKFEDVELDYGVQGDTAYMNIETRPGYEVWVSGSVGGNDSELTVLTVRKIGGSQKDSMHFEEELGTGEDPCRWTIKFQDKTIVIENGKLVEERRKE